MPSEWLNFFQALQGNQSTLSYTSEPYLTCQIALPYPTSGDLMSENIQYSDGRVLKVTANLSLLLSKFRTFNSNQLLWIDAICINQDDMDERSQQVQLMGEIYKKAAQVLMWIGDQTTYTADAIPVIQRLATLLVTFKVNPEEAARDLQPYAEEQELELSTKEWIAGIQMEPSWSAVIDILSRPYFDRLWIIQEIVLPSRAMVICGGHRIEWKILYESTMCLQILHSISVLSSAAQEAQVYLLRRLHMISFLGQLTFRVFAHSMFEILILFPYAKVTDPRDYIYGYLGILDDQSLAHNIQVDYSKTVEEVFHNATTNIILLGQDISSFEYQSFEPSSRPRPLMPSWARDWGAVETRVRPREIPQIDDLLGNEQVLEVEGEFLTIQGLILDSIERVSGNFHEANVGRIVVQAFVDHLSGFSGMTLENVEAAARRTFQCFDSKSKSKVLPFLEKSFFTLLASSLLGEGGLIPAGSSQNPEVNLLAEISQALQKLFPDEFGDDENVLGLKQNSVLLEWLISQDVGDDDFESCLLALYHRLFQRDPPFAVNLFKSTKGFEGRGPAGRNGPDDLAVVRVGDYIALFPTCDTPMILRKRSGDGAYTLIGTAHVGNLMGIPWYEGDAPTLVPIRLR
ncbi:hypothetical protein N431DRAFT_477671 [Stipitochalara longipes BDJ]|nr:hypothetical protein N431DRAFT_477671 [Stipitochalara longipes BDJ]